jgi:hypothetical protein
VEKFWLLFSINPSFAWRKQQAGWPFDPMGWSTKETLFDDDGGSTQQRAPEVHSNQCKHPQVIGMSLYPFLQLAELAPKSHQHQL